MVSCQILAADPPAGSPGVRAASGSHTLEAFYRLDHAAQSTISRLCLPMEYLHDTGAYRQCMTTKSLEMLSGLSPANSSLQTPRQINEPTDAAPVGEAIIHAVQDQTAVAVPDSAPETGTSNPAQVNTPVGSSESKPDTPVAKTAVPEPATASSDPPSTETGRVAAEATVSEEQQGPTEGGVFDTLPGSSGLADHAPAESGRTADPATPADAGIQADVAESATRDTVATETPAPALGELRNPDPLNRNPAADDLAAINTASTGSTAEDSAGSATTGDPDPTATPANSGAISADTDNLNLPATRSRPEAAWKNWIRSVDPDWQVLLLALLTALAGLFAYIWMRTRKLSKARVAVPHQQHPDHYILEENLIRAPEQRSQKPAANPTTRRNERSRLTLLTAGLSTAERVRHSIELLLYWMSFADDRYDPEMRQRLLGSENLSPHDSIKKIVLLNDHESLADAMKTLKQHSSDAELEQIIKLVLTVLVKAEITPSQNLILRFFADYIEIGSDGLDNIYQTLFDRPLPGAPRPDDTRWWRSQYQNTDAEIQAVRKPESEKEVMLQRLGLQEPATQLEIQQQMLRIRSRCDSAHYSLLGHKEQQLIQRHLNKYLKAFEYLTGEYA